MIIFTHTQSAPMATWTINHNLGCKPTFDVMIQNEGASVKVYPMSVVHVTDNLLHLSFSTPRTGTARLIGTPL